MNEDYLWNKTGSDAEIEGFEKALRPFASREAAPPMLPVKSVKPANIVNTVGRKPAKRLGYAMAVAACLLIAVMVSVGVLMRQSSQTSENEQVASAKPATLSPLTNDQNADAAFSQPGVNLPVKIRSEKQPPIAAQKIARAVSVRPAAIKLTKEEVFAYDQLKLALSITGSKLKLIKDKVENTADKKAVR